MDFRSSIYASGFQFDGDLADWILMGCVFKDICEIPFVFWWQWCDKCTLDQWTWLWLALCDTTCLLAFLIDSGIEDDALSVMAGRDFALLRTTNSKVSWRLLFSIKFNPLASGWCTDFCWKCSYLILFTIICWIWLFGVKFCLSLCRTSMQTIMNIKTSMEYSIFVTFFC